MLKRSFGIIILISISVMLMPSLALAAGGEMPSLVHDIGISLLLAGVVAVVFARFNIPNVAAFLIAGIVAGPIGLRLVTDLENIDTIAQLGFILMMFLFGLEIDVRKIINSSRASFIIGLIQYPLTVLFGFGAIKLLLWLGVGAGLIDAPYAAIYIGLVLAGSSTLLIVKLFQQNFEMDTQPGRIAISLLIFQDVWAIIAILIQQNLDEPQMMPILMSFIGIAVLIILSVILAKTIVNIGFNWISKIPELILVGALGWCFAIVTLGTNLDEITLSLFGTGLNISVGAGVAGLIAGSTIASLPHSIEIIAKVGVVKDFFVTLFFVGLGMSIPAPDGFKVVVIALIISVLALIARQIIFFPLLYWSGADQRNSQVSSIRLAPLSEFGLVIAFLGTQLGHISGELSSSIIFAFILTTLLAHYLYKHAYGMYEKSKVILNKLGFKEPEIITKENVKTCEIAILGFHRAASSLLHELSENSPEILSKTLVVDFNVTLHDQIRSMEIGRAHV